MSTSAEQKNAADRIPRADVNSLSRIRSSYPRLAASEMRVADWIMQQPAAVVKLSMAQVAESCGVSDTTVLRFCRAAGFQGFTDLKLSIASDLSSPTQLIHDDIDAADSPMEIARKVFLSNVQALYDTLAMLDPEAIARAAKLLRNAQRILIVGVGTSGPIVQSMYEMFFRQGLNCRAQTDSYLQLMEVSLLGPQDVVVAISQSGRSIDPTLTLKLAKKNGVATVCITGNDQSQITEYADVTLLSIARETRAESIASRIAQATIVDALYVILAFSDVETAVENEQRIWSSLLPKMY